MLVLTRKLMEKLFIGDDICVTVVRLEGGQVRLGIDAPRDVSVVRAELVPERQFGSPRGGHGPAQGPGAPVPPPNQVPGSEYSHAPSAFVRLVSSRLTPSLRPSPEGDVRAPNEQLAHFTFRRQLSIFVDNRQFIAQQRITDGNSLFAFRHNFTDKPLHHRRLGGGVDELD